MARLRPATQPNPGDSGVMAGSVLLTDGQFAWRLELSLRALARADRELGDWRFRIIGDGPYRQRLERLSADLGIAERIEFVGALSQQEAWGLMAASDLFLFTSVRDTSAGVNLEAMALGLPVLCIEQHGVADITTDECAVRIPVGPIEETVRNLSEALVGLAGDPARRQELGSRARERARIQLELSLDEYEVVRKLYARRAASELELRRARARLEEDNLQHQYLTVDGDRKMLAYEVALVRFELAEFEHLFR